MGKAWGGPRGGRLGSSPSAAHSPFLAQQTWVAPAAERGGEWLGAPGLGRWGMGLGLPRVVPAMAEGEGVPGNDALLADGVPRLSPNAYCSFPFPIGGALPPTRHGWGALPSQRGGPLPLTTHGILLHNYWGGPPQMWGALSLFRNECPTTLSRCELLLLSLTHFGPCPALESPPHPPRDVSPRDSPPSPPWGFGLILSPSSTGSSRAGSPARRQPIREEGGQAVWQRWWQMA